MYLNKIRAFSVIDRKWTASIQLVQMIVNLHKTNEMKT